MIDDEEFAAVVYDLDGTLVRLDVDWAALEADLEALFREAGRDPGPHDAWELLAAAEDAGLGERAETMIAAAERDGAETADRLPLADDLPRVADGKPVGVVSLNCEAAVRTALADHGLLAYVDSVVGRDTIAVNGPRKPSPEPLLRAVRELDAEPGGTLFVGDSDSDRVTAERAGTGFERV